MNKKENYIFVVDRLSFKVNSYEKLQKDIKSFLNIISNNKQKRFVELQENNLQNLVNTIFSKINFNKKLFAKTNSLEVLFFLQLLKYFITHKTLGSLEDFEKLFLEKNKIDNTEFKVFFGTPIFYKQLIETLTKIIDDKIELLLEQILEKENKSKLISGEIATDLVEQLGYDNEDDEEIDFELLKVERKGEIIDKMILALINEPEQSIAMTLYKNNLIDDYDSLMFFLEEKKNYYLSDKKLKKLYNFFSGLIGDDLEKSFAEYKKLYYTWELLQFKNIFIDYTKKVILKRK